MLLNINMTNYFILKKIVKQKCFINFGRIFFYFFTVNFSGFLIYNSIL